jgi:hypothetical protein
MISSNSNARFGVQEDSRSEISGADTASGFQTKKGALACESA